MIIFFKDGHNIISYLHVILETYLSLIKGLNLTLLQLNLGKLVIIPMNRMKQLRVKDF
jgi:hypothetical protein